MEGNLKVKCGKGCWIVKQEIGYFHGKIWEMGVKTVKIILTTQVTHGNSQLFYFGCFVHFRTFKECLNISSFSAN